MRGLEHVHQFSTVYRGDWELTEMCPTWSGCITGTGGDAVAACASVANLLKPGVGAEIASGALTTMPRVVLAVATASVNVAAKSEQPIVLHRPEARDESRKRDQQNETSGDQAVEDEGKDCHRRCNDQQH